MLSFSASWEVPEDHPGLAGHFPGHPIIPAVMLLDAVATALQARLGNIRIDAVRSAKFSSPILPAQRVTLHIAADAATGRARFRCEVDGRVATQGEMGFVAAAEPAHC